MAGEDEKLLEASYGSPKPQKKQAEVRSYTPGLYDQAMYNLTDAWTGNLFGDLGKQMGITRRNATPRDLENTKRAVNAILAGLPVAGPLLNRLPKDRLVPAAIAAGVTRPVTEWIINNMLAPWALPAAGAKLAEPIMDVADPNRTYEPAARASENGVRGSDGSFTADQWRTAMYGNDPAEDTRDVLLPGPRRTTPPNISMEHVWAEEAERQGRIKRAEEEGARKDEGAKASPRVAGVYYGDMWPWQMDHYGGRKKDPGIPPLEGAPYGSGGTAKLPDEETIRNSYSDYDLGYGRQPIDPDYQDWRRRAVDELYARDLNAYLTQSAIEAMNPGYKPRNGERMVNNVEDRRRDGEQEMAHHQFLADLIQGEPSYAENYGPLPGPRARGGKVKR